MDRSPHKNKAAQILAISGVLLLSAVSAFWMLPARTLNNHECFVSIAAREMLESGDWVLPTCNATTRLQKTPLSYWLVASLARITGRVDELTARLPSAICAVLSAAAILYFITKWFSLRTAILSAAVWVTSLGYIRYSHNARPEMVLTFLILLCFLSFYSAITAKQRQSQVLYMLVFWISFGLANLAKGPAPLPLVLVPLFFYVAVFRGFHKREKLRLGPPRQWKMIPKLLPIIGPLIFLAIILPWPLAVAHRVNWDLILWKREFVDRFFGQYAPGHKHFYYYFLRMFLFAIPWAAFLPMALIAPFYKAWNNKRPALQFLWLWFVVDLIFLTICGGKRQHYILPLMPAMAILIAVCIEDMAFLQKVYTAKQARGTLRNHIIALIVLAIAAPIAVLIAGALKQTPLHEAKTNSQLLTDAVVIGITMIIIAVVVTLLFAKKRPAFACASVFVAIIAVAMIAYVRLAIPLDPNRYSRAFSTKVRRTVPPSDKLVAYKWVSNRSVHYLGRVVPIVEDKSALYEFYEHGGWVLATREFLQELQQSGQFRTIYYRQKAERRGQQDTPGALLHKSAPKVQADTQT